MSDTSVSSATSRPCLQFTRPILTVHYTNVPCTRDFPAMAETLSIFRLER